MCPGSGEAGGGRTGCQSSSQGPGQEVVELGKEEEEEDEEEEEEEEGEEEEENESEEKVT